MGAGAMSERAVPQPLRPAARPSTPLRAGPSTPLRAGPSTPLRAGPSTPLRAGPSTPLRAGPSTPLRAGLPWLRALGFDPLLLILAGVMIVFGLVMVYSASWDVSWRLFGNPNTMMLRQLGNLAIGLLAMAAASVFP